MNRQKIILQFLSLALAGLLIASAARPVEALARQSSPAAVLIAPRSPLVIPAAAFSSDGYEADSFFFTFSGGYIQGKSGTTGCVKAPADLPKWATVSDVYASVYDNDGTIDLQVDVRRVNHFTGAQNPMASLATSGASTSIRTLSDLSINYPFIEPANYAYYVTLCLQSASIHLYSVRIYYTGPYHMSLPAVKR